MDPRNPTHTTQPPIHKIIITNHAITGHPTSLRLDPRDKHNNPTGRALTWIPKQQTHNDPLSSIIQTLFKNGPIPEPNTTNTKQ